MPNLYQKRHVESDGLVFDLAQIIKRTANGVAGGLTETNITLFLIHKCHRWKKNWPRVIAVIGSKWQSVLPSVTPLKPALLPNL